MPPAGSGHDGAPVSRRRLFARAAALSAGAALTGPLLDEARAAGAAAPTADPVVATGPATALDMTLRVNGQSRALSVDPRVTLLDALRERLGLTGTKKGCDRGQCGACTVHVDGRRVLSCLTLVASVAGHDVTTVEGLSPGQAFGQELHPVQQAFIDHDGFQCGSCTSGQIMSAVALIREGHAGDAGEIREWMSGNICRCGAYENIVGAVQQAANWRGADR